MDCFVLAPAWFVQRYLAFDPFAGDFRLDSSYSAWIAFEGHPFDRARPLVAAVVVVAACAVVGSSFAAYCLAHCHPMHLDFDFVPARIIICIE